MLSTRGWRAPQPIWGPSGSVVWSQGLLALTAPDEPPIFSRSRRDNLESSWVGLAGGGPSFSHPWMAAEREK